MAWFFRKFVYLFFFVVLGAAITGVALDILNINPNKGIFDLPSRGFSGIPISYTEMDQTQMGLVKRGYVLDFHLDCTSGMVTLEVFKQKFLLRQVTKSEIAVHKPRETCILKRFKPKF